MYGGVLNVRKLVITPDVTGIILTRLDDPYDVPWAWKVVALARASALDSWCWGLVVEGETTAMCCIRAYSIAHY